MSHYFWRVWDTSQVIVWDFWTINRGSISITPYHDISIIDTTIPTFFIFVFRFAVDHPLKFNIDTYSETTQSEALGSLYMEFRRRYKWPKISWFHWHFVHFSVELLHRWQLVCLQSPTLVGQLPRRKTNMTIAGKSTENPPWRGWMMDFPIENGAFFVPVIYGCFQK